MHNPFIYGKDQTDGIVSIEVDNDKAFLFLNDGSVKEVANKFWFLSPKPLDRNFVRLDGNLHYKFGRQFSNKSEFSKWLNIYNSQEQDIYVVYNAKEALMLKDGYTYFKGLTPKSLGILSFDIETTGISHNSDSKVLLISNTYRKGDETFRRMFSYEDYENCGQMLSHWCEWVREINPSILLGHNIYSYDLPYMQYCASKFDKMLELGRDGRPLYFSKKPSAFRYDGSRDIAYNKVHCYGREVVDTMFLAISYDVGRKYESFALKTIIKQEGLEKEGRTFIDASKIKDLCKIPEEWKKIKQYAEEDSDDSLKLYDFMIPALFYSAQTTPKSFQTITESATGSRLNSFLVRSYLQDRHSVPKASPAVKFEGAISFGVPGIYNNVVKIDVKSEYPSCILEYNIYDQDKDPKQHFYKMVDFFTQERFKNKKLSKETGEKYYEDLEQSQKLVINSAYGLLGATGLNFNSPANAALVTKKGREIVVTAIEWATGKSAGHWYNLALEKTFSKEERMLDKREFFNFISHDFILVNCDTDSISFGKQDGSSFTSEEVDNLINEINQILPTKIQMDNDGVYKKVIVLKAKNYILYDPDNKNPKKRITKKGSSLKSATLEPIFKEFLEEMIVSTLNEKTDLVEIYHKYVKAAVEIQDIKPWAKKVTISSRTEESDRANETKIIDALKAAKFNYSEGDKFYLYYKPDGTLSVAEQFDGIYDKIKMLEKLYKVTERFETILPKGHFIDYTMVKTQEKLKELTGQIVREKKVRVYTKAEA